MSRLGNSPIELGDIQSTLLLPLVGRAKANDMDTLAFSDETAKQLIFDIGADLEAQFRAVDLYSTLCYASRAMKATSALEEFIGLHPRATVINIGAGLDTIFDRIDNGLVRWYDLDLPDVVRLRRKLLPEGPRNSCIAKSLFDYSWFDDVTSSEDGVFMLAGGVLMYYTDLEVMGFLLNTASRFPNAELLFDALSREAVRTMNETASKSGGKNVAIQWGVDGKAEIEAWSERIKVLSHTPYFKHFERQTEWGDVVLNQIHETDQRNISSFIHLRFEG